MEHNHDGFEHNFQIQQEMTGAGVTQVETHPLAIGKIIPT
jgi:hypothetical protein